MGCFSLCHVRFSGFARAGYDMSISTAPSQPARIALVDVGVEKAAPCVLLYRCVNVYIMHKQCIYIYTHVFRYYPRCFK